MQQGLRCVLCIARTAGYNPLFCRTWHCGFQYDTYSMVYQGGRQCIHVNVLFAWNVLQRELRMMARNGVWIRRTQPQEHDLLLIHGILQRCACVHAAAVLSAAAAKSHVHWVQQRSYPPADSSQSAARTCWQLLSCVKGALCMTPCLQGRLKFT